MPRRLKPTLADYVAIAISPVLIMFLVGSLVFFLVEVFYQGQFSVRLTFILAMFVMAAVCIARLSIEEGREYATLFAIPLAIVTGLAMFRYVQFSGPLASLSWLVNLGLIALVWWCADRLTWDCTVIDESDDASGEGLLQTVGIDGDPDQQLDADSGTEPAAMAEKEPVAKGLWERFVEHRRRPHAPGVWVVYFSLAALPIFGFGQWFISSDRLDGRRYAFNLLVLFVAAALGLLLTTSFLGLRRYLRKRYLEMPQSMAGVWMGVGVVMIVALLAVCLLMPRRNPEYAVTQLPIFAQSPDSLMPSKWGFGNDGPERDEANRQVQREDNQDQQQGNNQQGGQQGGEDGSQDSNSNDAQGNSSDSQGNQSQQQGRGEQQSQEQDSHQSGQSETDGQQNGESKQGDRGQSESSKSDNSSDQQSNGERQQGESQEGTDQQDGQRQEAGDNSSSRGQQTESDESERSSSQRQSESSRSPSRSRLDPTSVISNITSTLGNLVKFVYWLIVILVIGFLLWKYWDRICLAFRNLIKNWREFWARLFGRRRQEEAEAESEATAQGSLPRPFSDFHDPFVSGMSERYSPDELIQYTFAAFEAWGRERGCERQPEQTPHEFAEAAALHTGALGQDALRLAELYSWSAFGKSAVPQSTLEHLRRFWRQLDEAAVASG